MRRLLLVLLVGCGTSNPSDGSTGCPEAHDDAFGGTLLGSPCFTTRTCFVENDFSSCGSAYYHCSGGTWQIDHYLGAANGASCSDSPLASCSFEGNPGCDTAPTAEYCSCDADGTWHCTCACDDPARATCS
ncbi:MAG TPA: hypothetical protein VL326_13255 [Kofleriaceae bacterium]|jgi:hypothetical protein|nr:hypothetical protein [Kofleriaceae bacterium]